MLNFKTNKTNNVIGIIVLEGFLVYWIPFYFPLKLVFLLWCMSPQYKVSLPLGVVVLCANLLWCVLVCMMILCCWLCLLVLSGVLRYASPIATYNILIIQDSTSTSIYLHTYSYICILSNICRGLM